jgi:hypothetical protein
MGASGVPNGLDAEEVGERAEVLHCKANLEFGNNSLHGGLIVTCDNDIIYVD